MVFKNARQNPDLPMVLDITPQDLESNLQNVFLVDVREPGEFTGELGHIEGALLVPLATVPEKIAEFSEKECVVFVCKSGGRSTRAAAFAHDSGLKNIYNLKGGMMLWNQLDLPTEK